MKKTYISPELQVVKVACAQFLASSAHIGGDIDDLLNGGEDTEGIFDPE